MATRLYLYPLWLRIWHAANALFFLTLIVTGLSMQYSPKENPVIDFSLAISLHNIAGILLILGYLYFLVANFFSHNFKHYILWPRSLFARLKKQAIYYGYGIFKGEHPPFPITADQKFNPLQKLSYVGVMYILVPISIITGLALLFPEYIFHQVFGMNGTMLTALLHMFVGFILTLFLLIHLYFASLSKKKFANFKSMLTGWHEH
jgi:thiosulfate reductase cytochrome b subunit